MNLTYQTTLGSTDVTVDAEGVLRVYDEVAQHFTVHTDHAVSEADKARILNEAYRHRIGAIEREGDAIERANRRTAKVARIQAANDAANAEHSRILDATNAGATMYVCSSVVTAAEEAYKEAGGKREIRVVGEGNRTHPVISVRVEEI